MQVGLQKNKTSFIKCHKKENLGKSKEISSDVARVLYFVFIKPDKIYFKSAHPPIHYFPEQKIRKQSVS